MDVRRSEDMSQYALPPLRSPGLGMTGGASNAYPSSRDGHHGRQGPALGGTGENGSYRTDREETLQRETDSIRAMLAAKERELVQLRGT